MSSNGFLPSLEIDRHHCPRVAWLVGGMALLALSGIALAGPPGLPHALAAVLVAGAGVIAVRRHAPGGSAHVARICLDADGRIRLGWSGRPAALVDARLASHWLLPGVATGLAFRDPTGRRCAVLLFRDQLSPEAWRRLLVWLRLAPHRQRGANDPAPGRPACPKRFT